MVAVSSQLICVTYFFRVSESVECKMSRQNLSRVFGPTMIGYSSADPAPLQIMDETGKQTQVKRLMKLLVNI